MCAPCPPQVFWPEEPHALRPLTGRYTFSNLHALGVGNVLCAWVRPQATAAYESMSDEEVLSDVGATLHKVSRHYVASQAECKAWEERKEHRSFSNIRCSFSWRMSPV
jgi:hypothetical protein